MKQTIDLHQFRDAFQAIRPDNFSYEGLEVLYDFFEEWSESGGEEIELDVIAICCEFSESTPDEIIDPTMYGEQWKDYVNDHYDIEDVEPDQLIGLVSDCLNDHTLVCGETDSTIIYQDF